MLPHHPPIVLRSPLTRQAVTRPTIVLHALTKQTSTRGVRPIHPPVSLLVSISTLQTGKQEIEILGARVLSHPASPSSDPIPPKPPTSAMSHHDGSKPYQPRRGPSAPPRPRRTMRRRTSRHGRPPRRGGRRGRGDGPLRGGAPRPGGGGGV